MNAFHQEHFLTDGFRSPYRSDRDSKGGGIMLYVTEDIHSNFLASGNKPIEYLYLELNLQNINRLKNCSYNCHKAEIVSHLAELNIFSGNTPQNI